MKCQLITRKFLMINSKIFEFLDCAYSKQKKANRDKKDELQLQVYFFLLLIIMGQGGMVFCFIFIHAVLGVPNFLSPVLVTGATYWLYCNSLL